MRHSRSGRTLPKFLRLEIISPHVFKLDGLFGSQDGLFNSEPVDLSPSTMPLYEGSPYMSAKWGDTKFEIKAPGLLGDDGQPIEKSVLNFSGSWK